eukprot:TRINITY_DN1089_c0_g1_i1.p1 TRINITY_DN1089_c0_g1~~TRINITY_DN1089_c0_g1_i1.p1  ORF type:complete len:794 (-),score=338.41 TRINITY_DN1089_c0_g1_i1:273-2654(-)
MWILALICILATPCASTTVENVVVQLSSDVSGLVSQRITSLLVATGVSVQQLPPDQTAANLTATTLLLSAGNSVYARRYLDAAYVASLGSEAYAVVSASDASGALVVAVDGNALHPDPLSVGANGGLLFGIYEALKQLGFGFLHPLQPVIPPSLSFPAALNITQRPYWPVRGFHYHSMHPLELTHLFNGFGPKGPDDAAGWLQMLPEMTPLAEWLVANRQNRFEWVLLGAKDWAVFANSTVRQAREAQLVSVLHAFGIAAGADMPIAEQQQHAWYMVTGSGTLEEQIEQIHARLDWLVAAGFDFLSTESGYSEFTHPDDVRMLAWMNESAIYLREAHNKTAYIKCHCSTGQTCKDYKDPWTGEPLNFNFLPYYADERLGIYPHTVQMYAFDDPAPTYGNVNFTYMLNFMMNESSKREVIFHGETAYWVNYDIDVPLFLPLYGLARLRDMRTIAVEETRLQTRVLGQMNFDSGWEWGYWLQDVLTAAAVWDPMVADDEQTALRRSLQQALMVFGAAADELSSVLVATINMQRDLLVFGLVNGSNPSNIVRRNGQAYLEGWDTWSDIGCLFTTSSCTQPEHQGLEAIRVPGQKPDYETEIKPLLQEMALQFAAVPQQLAAVAPLVPPHAASLLAELIDSANITSCRAEEVFNLYEYSYGLMRETPAWRAAKLAAAKDAILRAAEIVASREAHYRVPVERIAGWGPNPTAYTYGYVWTVHSLYYFWRDFSKAVADSADVLSPCFMNIINPIDVAFGEGIGLNVSEVARIVLDKLPYGKFVGDCLAAPEHEPHYPPA